MSTVPSLSIVIPTYNRRARLARVLDALEKQNIGPDAFEVIIVDDGSTDDTPTWLDAQSRPYALRVIHQENCGPARARNTGVEAARAALLIFLDDDVEPSPQLVREHLNSHAGEPDLAVMGPLASLAHYRQPWVAWEQAKLEVQYAAMMRGDWEPSFRQFWTGNASVARAHVIAAGGFNPDFLRAEDVELAYRLHQRGVRFRFNPKARGLHHAERSLDSWEHAHRSYGRLEVRIFGTAHEMLMEILGTNWAKLHPAMRWLIQQCLAGPRRHATTSLALRRWLELEAKLDRSILSSKVCSMLANVTYWHASVAALGPERAERVFRHGEELRRSWS